MSRYAHAGFGLVLGTLLVSLGCDKPSEPESQYKSVGFAVAPGGPSPQYRQPTPAPDQAPAGGAKPAALQAEPPMERKIIFNGHLEVIVKEFDAARTEVTKLIEQHKGYFAKSEVLGDAGSKRTGTFTIKVPVDKFQTTVDALTKLGIAVKNSTDSQDVTEEFVDVQARVKNLKAEEEVLNKLLKDAAGRLDELFKIREQIRMVRGDIEKAEGRMKALGTLTALSTITLTIREEKDYVPPTVEAPPTFASRVAGTFDASVAMLVRVGEAVALFVTAVAPWLPLIAVAAVLIRWAVVLSRRHEARTARPGMATPTDRASGG